MAFTSTQAPSRVDMSAQDDEQQQLEQKPPEQQPLERAGFVAHHLAFLLSKLAGWDG